MKKRKLSTTEITALLVALASVIQALADLLNVRW
jgi:hypothetical protein